MLCCNNKYSPSQISGSQHSTGWRVTHIPVKCQSGRLPPPDHGVSEVSEAERGAHRLWTSVAWKLYTSLLLLSQLQGSLLCFNRILHIAVGQGREQGNWLGSICSPYGRCDGSRDLICNQCPRCLLGWLISFTRDISLPSDWDNTHCLSLLDSSPASSPSRTPNMQLGLCISPSLRASTYHFLYYICRKDFE